MSHTYPKVGCDVINILKLWAVNGKELSSGILYEFGPGWNVFSMWLAISRLLFRY